MIPQLKVFGKRMLMRNMPKTSNTIMHVIYSSIVHFIHGHISRKYQYSAKVNITSHESYAHVNMKPDYYFNLQFLRKLQGKF